MSRSQVGFTELDAELPFLTKADQRQYARAFQNAGHVHGYLAGDRARTLFLKSGLSSDSLSRIWDLSDIDGNGYLTFSEFAVALFLINAKRRGVEVPVHLPEHIYRQLKKNVCSDYRNLWAVNEQERETYKRLFHTNRVTKEETDQDKPFGSATSYLGRYEADRVFIKSGLSLHTIDSIWRLADVDHNGRLDEEEFCVAMTLITRHLAGEPLCDQLPEELFPPSHRAFVQEEMLLDRRKWRKSFTESSVSDLSSSKQMDEKKRHISSPSIESVTSPSSSSEAILRSKLNTLQDRIIQSDRHLTKKVEEEQTNQMKIIEISRRIAEGEKAKSDSKISKEERSQIERDLRRLKNQAHECEKAMNDRLSTNTGATLTDNPQIMQLRREIQQYDDESQYVGLSESEKITKKGAVLLAKRIAEMKLTEWQRTHPSLTTGSSSGVTEQQIIERDRKWREQFDDLSKVIEHLEQSLEKSGRIDHDLNEKKEGFSLAEVTKLRSPSSTEKILSPPYQLSSSPMTASTRPSSHMDQRPEFNGKGHSAKYSSPISSPNQPIILSPSFRSGPIKESQAIAPKKSQEISSSKSPVSSEGLHEISEPSGSRVTHLKDRFEPQSSPRDGLSFSPMLKTPSPKPATSFSPVSTEQREHLESQLSKKRDAMHRADSTSPSKPPGGILGVTRSEPKFDESWTPQITSEVPMTASQQTVRALYDFAGRDREELSFSAGDHLVVHQKLDEDWCYGELNGSYGLFPVSYVDWDHQSGQRSTS